MCGLWSPRLCLGFGILLHDSFPTFNFEAIIFSISMVKIGIFFFSIGRGLHERGRCPTFPFGVHTVLGPCAESLEWMSFKTCSFILPDNNQWPRLSLQMTRRLPSQQCFACYSCLDPCLPFAGMLDDLDGFNDQEIEFQTYDGSWGKFEKSVLYHLFHFLRVTWHIKYEEVAHRK